MILIICLWALLMLELARFTVGIRNAVKSARGATTTPLAKKIAGSVIIILFVPAYLFTTGVLIAAIITLTDMQ